MSPAWVPPESGLVVPFEEGTTPPELLQLGQVVQEVLATDGDRRAGGGHDG